MTALKSMWWNWIDIKKFLVNKTLEKGSFVSPHIRVWKMWKKQSRRNEKKARNSFSTHSKLARREISRNFICRMIVEAIKIWMKWKLLKQHTNECLWRIRISSFSKKTHFHRRRYVKSEKQANQHEWDRKISHFPRHQKNTQLTFKLENKSLDSLFHIKLTEARKGKKKISSFSLLSRNIFCLWVVSVSHWVSWLRW